MPNYPRPDPIYQITVYHQIVPVDDGELIYSPETYSVIHPDGMQTIVPISIISSPDRCFEVIFRRSVQEEMQKVDIYLAINIDQLEALIERGSLEHVELLQYLHQMIAHDHIRSIHHASKEVVTSLAGSIALLDQPIQIPSYLMAPMFSFDPNEGLPNPTPYYHLKTRKIVRVDQTDPDAVRFKYSGGVLQTNAPLDAIELLVARYPNAIIDGPDLSITLPDHLKRFQTDLSIGDNDNLDRVGIFVDLIPDQYARVSKIASDRNYRAIWVIQTMPYLWYYRGPSSLNGMDRLMRIWSRYDREHTRTHKQDHYMFLITRFDRFYRIHYRLDPAVLASSATIRLQDAYQTIYAKWERCQLAYHNPAFRIKAEYYREISQAITKVKNAILYLSAIAAVPSDRVEATVVDRLERLSLQWTEITNRCQKTTASLDKINQIYPAQELGEAECTYEYLLEHRRYLQVASRISEELTKLQRANYQTHETDCPICYCESEIHLICGHRICIDCLPPTLSNNDTCPICKSMLCLSFATIDAGDQPRDQSHIIADLGPLDLLVGSNMETFQDLGCQTIDLLSGYPHGYLFDSHPKIIILSENCGRDLASWLGHHLVQRYPDRATIIQLPELQISEWMG